MVMYCTLDRDSELSFLLNVASQNSERRPESVDCGLFRQAQVPYFVNQRDAGHGRVGATESLIAFSILNPPLTQNYIATLLTGIRQVFQFIFLVDCRYPFTRQVRLTKLIQLKCITVPFG